MQRGHPSGTFIDLLQPRHRQVIKDFQSIAGTPELIIHSSSALNKRAQTVAFQADQYSGSVARDADGSALTAIVPVGSYSKLFLALAFMRLFADPKYDHLKITLETNVNGLFIDTFPPGQEVNARPLESDPTLYRLLLHYKGLPNLDKYLFACDGCCIMTEEEVLQLIEANASDPLSGNHPEQAQPQYSNLNYIFAGILLQRIFKQPLHKVMEDLVFKELGLNRTFMGRPMTDEQRESARPGYHIDSKGKMKRIVPPQYGDSVEGSAFGSFSCIQDIARLHQHFLHATRGNSSFLTPNMMGRLFKAPQDSYSLLGECFDLYSDLTLPTSINSCLQSNLCSGIKQPYKQHGEAFPVQRVAGYVDGYSIATYHVWKKQCFVTVMGNTSGPLDITDHVAQYILQESFQLKPEMNRSGLRHLYNVGAERLAQIENQAPIDSSQNANFESIAGEYWHNRIAQCLTIQASGRLFMHGHKKSSRAFQIVWAAKADKLYITAGQENFLGISTWEEWKDLSFEMETEWNGALSLKNGKDKYTRKIQ